MDGCQVHYHGRGRPGRTADLSLIIPVSGKTELGRISKFGEPRGGRRRHLGIDIFAESGTAVLAPQSGTIVKMSNGNLAGNYIWLLDYREEFLYEFLHLEGFARNLEEGDFVDQGAIIGFVGKTGNAANTSPHLHFGIARLFEKKKVFGKKRYVDPLLFLSD